MIRSMTIETAAPAPRPVGGSDPSAAADLPDGVLLDRFATGRDEAAFEALVLRHGPKILRICRRWLGDVQAAEDACQATFVVLVRRAGEIRELGDIGGWLCGVARRVAGRAKMRADRERIREGAAVDVREVADRSQGPDLDDIHPVLRAEVDRLPEKYRRPIELCYWEGLSSDQAAERLRCPTGTLKWRLSRAREILRGRFVRRGIAMTAFLLWRHPATEAAVMKPRDALASPHPAGPAEAAFPTDLLRGTVDLAVFVRDFPPRLLDVGANRLAPRGRVRGGRFAKFVPLLAVLATAFLLTSAFSASRPSDVARKAAAFRRAASLAAPRAAALPTEGASSCH